MRKIYRSGLILLLLFVFNIGFTHAQNKYLSFTKDGRSNIESEESIKPNRTINDVKGQYLEVTYTFAGAMVSEQRNEKDVYNYLHIFGFGKMGQVGAPALPMRNDIIAMPKGVIAEVEIVDAEYIEVEGYDVYPTLEPARDTEGAPAPKFEKDLKVYKSNAFFPAKIAEVTSTQIMRGLPMATIQVRPVQFNPVTHTLRVYSRIVYRVNYRGLSIEVENGDSNKEQIDDFILNPNSVKSINSHRESGSGDVSKDYIIVTIDPFLDAAKKLAQWKAQLGYSVEIVSQPSWTSVKVKEAIHSRYNSWAVKPSYFVILGDNEQVPGQDLTKKEGEIYASDLYYSCMDGADDYTPDMAHGRISVASLEQANIVVDKIVNYEKNPVDDASFYQNGLNCAQFQDVQDGEPADGYAARRFCHTSEDIRDYVTAQGYDVERVYYTDSKNNPTNWNNGYYSTGGAIPDELLRSNGFNWNGGKDEIAASINAGKFYVFHRDHGYSGGVGWAHPEFLTSQISMLNNGDKLPVVFSINCHTGEFRLPECFAEGFLRKEGGGAVGVVGAAYYSLSGNNDGFALGMVDAIWPNPGVIPEFGNGTTISNPGPSGVQHSIRSMGDVVNQGLLRMVQTWDSNLDNRIYTYRLFHYFGDPAMKIWVEKPKAITAEFPNEITCGATSLQIKNISLANALVTLVQDGNILAKVNAVNGVADLTFGAIDNIAKAVVTISAQDYDPIEKEYLVQGCTNAPLSQFSASPLTLIIGENDVVNFVDNSKYSPTSWLWNFGSDDIEFVEATSTASQNPKVKYTKAGQYTVMLQSTNENGSNSVSKDNYITVYDKANGANCQPATKNLVNNYGFGIQKFALAEINQSSGSAVQDGGYMDFSGSAFANVIPGYSYDISITVGSVNPEHAKVYLDINKDGDFSEDEMLVYFSEFKGEKVSSVILPYNVTMGELLRLRVIDEYSGKPITDGCYSPTYGQVEDYSVVFVKGVPCIETGGASNLSFEGATLSAKVISDGKSAITKRGFAVANHSLPTVNDINIEDPSIAGNDFSLPVTGLTKNTKYSYRSYAINEMGISYGKEMSFQTFCDSPSEHVSGFGVSIPLSTWMALSWTDSKGDVLPWGYVIKWSDVSADAIVAPVDGVVENENSALEVAVGEEFGIVQGLNSNTKYYFKIYPFTNEGSSIDYLTEGEIPVTEGTTLNHRQYLTYTFKFGETNIKSAEFNTINNTAVRNDGYTDFTSISTAVNPGNTYSLKLSVDPGGDYKYSYCAWIDWNCDGWFDSETEKYPLGEATGAKNISKDILIPLNAKLGAKTMRIACQYKNEPESWGKISYGSAEDYTVNVDNAPTNLLLSASEVVENATVGTEVGTLSAIDVDANDEIIYTVVSDEFEVKGDKLVTKVTFDFETKSSYTVNVKATDKAGLFVEKEFTVTVTDINEAPVNLALSASEVAENASVGTEVGTLSANDVDANDEIIYTVVSDEFEVKGDKLVTKVIFDFETKSSYTVTVKATDKAGLFVENEFAITVTNVNEAPSAITLSNSVIPEDATVGTEVGTLSATDVDANDELTYSVNSNEFEIKGDKLVTKVTFDFETKSSYTVTVKATDKAGLSVEKEFTVTVTNVNEAPSVITLSNSVIPEDAAVGTEVGTLSATDVDANDELTYSVVSDEFEVKGDKLVTKVTFDFKTKSSYTVKAKATDKAGAFVEKEFTITITEVKTTSINKDLVSKVALYPNPVKSTLQLNSSVVISRVNIVNVIGVVVYSSDINASVSTINVADLKSGMYILKAFTSEGEITKRFIKE